MQMQKDHLQPASGISVSQEIVWEIRSGKLSAFVPVTAADLIWLEVFAIDQDISEHSEIIETAPSQGAC